MQPFSNKSQRVINEKFVAVSQWMSAADRSLQQKIQCIPKDDSFLFGGLAIFGGFGLLGVLIYLAASPGWPSAFTFGITLVVEIIFIVLGVRENRRNVWLYNINSEAQEAENTRWRADSPLYQRAKLISEAVANFKAHCLRYGAWYLAVDEGLQEPNDDAATRYHQFLQRSASVITRAIDNFTRAAKLTEQREKFRIEHPEVMQKPESTALSELVARLDQPTDAPLAPDLPSDAVDALAYEEALAELEADVPEVPPVARLHA